MVGTGTSEAAQSLLGIRAALGDLAVAADRSWQRTSWVGSAGDAAAEFTGATVAALDVLADRAGRLGESAMNATDAVARARERLEAIADEFEATASALETEIDEPGAADRLVEEARRALSEAEAVVEELRAELDGHQAAVAQPSSGAMPTMPMGAVPGFGSGSGGGSGSAPGAGHGTSGAPAADFSGSSGPHSDPSSGGSDDARPSADPGVFGSGVTVQLPDGSTATAPNAVAASAVRHALTQLGVPYDWGGTTPGVGLDCSGLTQWAYREAGLDLPRLAQEQDVGAAVDRTSLRPGDLAVWDGHVAMVVGNGLMVEAGDPVKLSAIRTTNAGQGFQGFWRPTA
jgi:cell wall-associated NlpC family hydrolase